MKKLIFKIVIIIFLIVVAISSLFIGIGYNMYNKALKEVSIKEKISDIKSDKNYTKIDDMTKTYKDAVVAVEDHRFYSHKGVDVIAVTRAMLRNLTHKGLMEGGSTITQQLAKNTYFTQNKEINRKIAEMFMAWKYEKECKKHEILELYVNTSYFGDGYYNIKEASEGYFNKMPNELNDYEATMLAGVPNAPSLYAPTVNFELASQRQRQVLEKMVEYKYISENEKNEIWSKTEQYREYFNK